MIDYCIAFAKREIKRKNFEIYVTDALKIITENTAKQVGGAYLQHRYYDVITEAESTGEEKEERTAEDIISNVKNKLNNL